MLLQKINQRLLAFLFCREPAIAPFDGHHIVNADVRRCDGNAVARLRHIVEARVIHDGSGSAPHACGELSRPQRVGRISVRGPHVVAQSQRVTHLVTGHEARRVADQAFRQLQGTRLRVGRSRLHHDPFAQQRLHVVPPDDVRLENLARSRVDHGRTHRVGLVRCGISQHRILHVIPLGGDAVRVVAHLHRVLESGLLESHVPVQDALLDIRPQVLRHGRVDIEHNRLDGLHELPRQISLLVLGLQSPARDVVLFLQLLLRVGIVQARRGEVAHERRLLASRHRDFGEQRQ